MKPFTPESRAAALAARKLAVAKSPYRRNWLDSTLWDELAKKHRVRLPQWHRPPTARKLKQAHESLEKVRLAGIPEADPTPFETVYGCSPARLIKLNPTMPLRAFIGGMLERLRTDADVEERRAAG